MESLVGDKIGLIHLVSSCFALFFGTLMLIQRKGTKQHVKIGYMYLISMAILILTAFLIYRLYSGWGVFHYLTIVSLITIALGMIPIWTKKPVNKWKYLHFTFMYWSIIGLYASFTAEILTRIPQTPFIGMVGVSTGLVTIIGGVCFVFKKSKWKKIFKT